MRARELAHLGAVLIKGNITDPMKTVFDRPMTAAEIEQTLRSRFLRCQTGQAVDRFAAVFAGNDFGGITPDGKDLCGIRKVEIASQFGAGPNRAQL